MFDVESHRAFLYWLNLSRSECDKWYVRVLGRSYSSDIPATDIVETQREAYRDGLLRR